MRLTVPDVMPLVIEIYKSHSAGCCLHLVLDDYNVEDYSVKACIDRATEQNHPKCLHLAELLLQMSKTQRKKLARDHWSFY